MQACRKDTIFDHAIPAPSIKDASAMVEGRRFAQEFGLKHVFDVGRHGISHVVLAENGLARPGELLVCADSHTCACGALNCAGRGAGILDTLQAITKGIVWYPVTPTVRYEFKGRLAPLVSGKDVFFHIAQTYGSHGNSSVEYGGPGIRALTMADRRTMATMSPEIGAEFALFDYDDATAELSALLPPVRNYRQALGRLSMRRVRIRKSKRESPLSCILWELEHRAVV